MQIYKFGGSILHDSKDLESLCDTLLRAGSEKVVVVLSALGSFTRDLDSASLIAATGALEDACTKVQENRRRTHDLAVATLREQPSLQSFLQKDAELDERCTNILRGISITRQRTARVGHMIRALGEDWAVALISAVMLERGIDHAVVDARSVVRTHSIHGDIRPDILSTTAAVRSVLLPELRRHDRLVIQGYVASDEHGETSTMGSESSNLTAALLGKILEADGVTVFSDVAGIMSIDPDLCSDARVMDRLDYASAHRLAVHGMKILYPTMIPLLAESSIPLVVRSLHDTTAPGTVIHDTHASLPLRCVICQYPVHSTQRNLPLFERESMSLRTDGTESNPLLQVRAASGSIEILSAHQHEAHDRETNPDSSFVTVFHEGIATAAILSAAAAFMTRQDGSRMGTWTVAADITCMSVPRELTVPLASLMHAAILPS